MSPPDDPRQLPPGESGQAPPEESAASGPDATAGAEDEQPRQDEGEVLNPAELPGNAPLPQFLKDQGPIDKYGIGGIRRHKLTDERVKRVLDLVAIGNYLDTAFGASGLNSTTYHRYMRLAEDFERKLEAAYGEDHDLAEFAELGNPWPDYVPDLTWRAWRLRVDMEKAQNEAEAYAVGIVRKHMEDNWAAAMTYLERKNPRRWRRRDPSQVEEEVQRQAEPVGELHGEEASHHLHEALRAASKGELPPGR